MFNSISKLLTRFSPSLHRTPSRPNAGSDARLGEYGIESAYEFMGRKLTPKRLTQILTGADQGRPLEQARLISYIQEAEPMIGAHLGTRKSAVLACPWSVSATTDDETIASFAHEVETMFKACGLRKAIKHLLDFVGTGYAGLAVDWAPRAERINGFRPIAVDRWVFDNAGNPGLLNLQGQEHAIASYHPGQFLIALNNAKPGLPCRNGLVRALAWMFLFKRSGLGGWARYVEKFGLPLSVAKLPPDQWNNKTERNRVLQLLQRLGREGCAVIPADAEMDFQETMGTGAEAQEKFSRYCDEVFAILILGQTASSGDSGGFSKGQIQENVREDLLGDDATTIIEAVQHLVDIYSRLRWGIPEGSLQFWIDYESSEDLDALATRWKTLTEITGKRIKEDQVAKEFGVEFGDPIQPETPSLPMNDRLLAFSDSPRVPRDQRAIDAIVDEALRRTVADEETLAAWHGPVIASVRKAFGDLDPETATIEEITARAPDFLATLPGLLAEMDTAEFERHLSGAMLGAALNGYTYNRG